MVKVILNVNTHYGSSFKKGDTTDVPERVADRWVKSGIALLAEPAAPEADETGEFEDYTPVNYERDYKAAELQQLAKSREIDGWDSMKKAELAKALEEDDRARYDAAVAEAEGSDS